MFPTSANEDTRGLAVAIAFMGLCSLVYAITRATAVRRTFATSRQRAIATFGLFGAVVRRQRARALTFASTCLLATLAVARLDIPVDVRVLLAVTPGLMLIVALASAWQLHVLAGLRAAPDLAVSSHGRFLYIARDSRLVGWVAAPPQLVSLASGIPSARLRTP